jgi:hypothetical protein
MVTTTNGIYLYNCTLNKYDLVTNFQSLVMWFLKKSIQSKMKTCSNFHLKNSNKNLILYFSAMINMRIFLRIYSCEKIQEKRAPKLYLTILIPWPFFDVVPNGTTQYRFAWLINKKWKFCMQHFWPNTFKGLMVICVSH